MNKRTDLARAMAGAVLTVSMLAACGSSQAPGPSTANVPPSDSASSTAQQLRRDGRWLVDSQNRVVLAHGVNLVWKTAPYVPPDSSEGFAAADADWLAAQGFNTARIGTLWVGVSPTAPGVIDHQYLDAWDRVVQLLAQRRIWMLFDFHQDMLGAVYQGEGVPEWAILSGLTTTLLGSPSFGFPFNYFTPQVTEAFEHLWAERGAVRDGYRAAWTAVAQRWRQQAYSMGYDLFNEPWAGLEWPTCIVTPLTGCPTVDTDKIQPFLEQAIAGIRSVDAHNLVWMEPQLLAGGIGAPTGFTAIAGENQLGYSFHNYCPLASLLQAAQIGLIVNALPIDTCENFERRVIAQARSTSQRIGAVELMTEFGATDDLPTIQRITQLADENLIGWTYWQYKNWHDPTTQSQGSGAQGLFSDDSDPGTVKTDKLRLLSRTYPQATAGIPLQLSFDPDSAAFSYRYTPRAASGPTEIFVPVALHYPQGYVVTVSGARVTSAANAGLLTLENLAGASEVSVQLLPRSP